MVATIKIFHRDHRTEIKMIPVMRPWLGPEEAAAVNEVMTSGWVAQGPRVAAFERALSAKVRASYGIAVSSCTGALHLALVALDLGPGDEVVVPSLSFIATANVARYVGATPVFADVDEHTQNLTTTTIAQVLTPRTRAVILVHQGGMPADIDAVRELCEPRGIEVVEDAACALGSTYKGRPIGSHSRLVGFSFHPRKVITTGEGGMLMTSGEEFARRIRRLRDHGVNINAADRHASPEPVLEEFPEVGFNYRMSDIQAAVGLVQLTRLDTIVARRRALAHRYRQHLARVPGVSAVGDPPHGENNFQSFWITLGKDFPLSRNDLLRKMMGAGISARRGFMAAHLEPAYADVAHGDLGITERLTRQTIVLPLFHELTEDEQDKVIEVVSEAARGSALVSARASVSR
jgi:dTDP-4-amino-4,6-dideoxygalactose transaminase